MKKIVLFSLSLCLPLLFVTPSYAELLAVDQYLSLKLGYSGVMADPIRIKGDFLTQRDGYTGKGYISTPNLSLAVGTYYATKYVAIRGETEYVVRFNAGKRVATLGTQNGVHDVTLHTTIQTILLNLFLDFNTRTLFVPYIGAGLGASLIDSKYNLDSVSDKKFKVDFSWQVSLGGAFYIVPALAIDIQTRYSHFGKSSYGSGNPLRMIVTTSGIDVFIGVRYTL